jgi:microcystin-dependent protein
MDPILGQITFFAFNFIPMGWAPCTGQFLNVMQNQALYSLLGVQFGGSYPNTFALPDLRGKVILGQGPGYNFASSGGFATTTLTINNLPAHPHNATLTLINATTTVKANTAPGTNNTPSSRSGNAIGILATDKGTMYNNIAPTVDLNVGGNTVGGSVTVAPAGGNQAFSNMPPYCVLNPAIAIEGLYPQRY